jgi:UDP-4-amino-4,6-dideoxy-N-acetyl-beta-L-altrosamine transaminase
MIPYGKQSLAPEDLAAVDAVLRSDWLTQGPKIPAFEAALSDYAGAAHAVVMANGTAALHAACAAAGVGPGDCVWTSPISFVASANAARYLGARVDFVDTDPATQNLCPKALEKKLQSCTQLPKALVVVHFAGNPCDLAAIHQIADAHGILIIEDAAHALGTTYEDSRIGDCRFSSMVCYSFHPVKNITTGEGGAVLTQQAHLAKGLRDFCSHGITKNPERFLTQEAPPWWYEQQGLGFNYRMTDFQAALGISQLSRLEDFIRERQRQVDYYYALLADLPLILPRSRPGCRVAWHIFPVQLQDPARRLAVFKQLRAAGVGVNVHYIPIHLQPDYQRLGFSVGDFPQAERYYQAAITLPLFVQLTPSEQDYVAQKLREALCA